MKTRISKAYRGSDHIGWKKTVGRRDWFLGYGTTPASEAKAVALAEVLEAKWRLSKVLGQSELGQTDFEEAKYLVDGNPRWSPIGHTNEPAATSEPGRSSLSTLLQATDIPTLVPVTPATSIRRWLHASIDEFVSTTRRGLKPDGSNGDYVFNLIANIGRAREVMQDIPLDLVRRKELDDWLLSIRAMKSKLTGKQLSPVTIRNIVAAVRVAMTKFAEWEWWLPPALWASAFKGYSVKKLETPSDRKRRRRKPPAFTVDEKRVLWHLALEFTRAMMALADWAGHTQKEIATLTFDEIRDENGEMFIDRDRHKTGVHGRWWIPPEAAEIIRKVVAKTPRDPAINPGGLAFLSPRNQPLVHRADHGSYSRSDYIGKNTWDALLRASRHYGVKHISFKGMRKATAQLIRDEWGKEVSRIFLAHADEDIQDEHYTRGSSEKVEIAMRATYGQMKMIFAKITADDWAEIGSRIRRVNGLPSDNESEVA